MDVVGAAFTVMAVSSLGARRGTPDAATMSQAAPMRFQAALAYP